MKPYVPRLQIGWLQETPQAVVRELEGTLVFVDISGFTTMTERLARKGKVGAEEVNDTLDALFGRLLAVAYEYGAGVVKWGGDAVLLLFDGEAHAPRACRAAMEMQRALRAGGRVATSSGYVTLRMSVGIHSGTFHFFLVGDLHRELVISGPGATRTVEMESIAEAGEVAVSPETAALLDPNDVGAPKETALLLRRAPQAAATGAEPVDTSGVDLARCLAAPIRELLQSGVVQPEHRTVTACFIEFRGIDDAIATDGPDTVAARLDELIRTVQAAAERAGVSFFETDISKNGGKIMLIAGAPRSTGHDEEAMLRFARQVLDARCAVPVRIGVNTGRVFSGNFGPPYRRTYSVKGDAVNTAARIMGKAEPGELLATDATLSRSRALFTTEPRGPFTLKGKAQPVAAHAVAALREERRGRERHTALVGREPEVARLQAALDEARAGRGAAVELVGEPGVGKSRLVEELLERADGFRAVEVACAEYEASTPYLTVGRVLRTVLGIDDSAGTPAAGERLRDVVATEAPELLPWLPLLAVPLDADVASTPEVDALEERFRGERLADALDDLLAVLMPSPAIVVLDDVHWIDDASANLFAHVARRIGGRPWLLVATRRDIPEGLELPGEAPVVRLVLAALPPSSAAALVNAVTAELPLPRHQVEGLVERAGGNPLFLQELVAAVKAGLEELPDSVEALLAAQIDRLPAHDRLVLRHASVLGTAVDMDLLDTLLAGVESDWRGAVGERLAEFLEAGDGNELRFRHALVRDAAYEGLAYRHRRELHARAGEAILARAGGEDAVEPAVLSLHFFHAQRFQDAWRYARLGAARAYERYALLDAADLYRRALAAGRQGKIDVAELAEVWEALGDVAERIGAYEEAAAAFRGARRHLRGSPLVEARLLLKSASVVEDTGSQALSLRLIGRGLKLLEDVPGDAAGAQRARLASRYAVGRFRQGKHREAVRWCERAIDEAITCGDKEALAAAYLVLDMVTVELDAVDDIPYGRLALQIYEELDDLPKQASILNNLGAAAYYEGRWHEALELYERAAELFERTGDVISHADEMYNIGELLCEQGRLAEAEERLTEASRIWRAAGRTLTLPYASRELARVAYRSGRYDEGLVMLAEARETFAAGEAQAEVLETDVRIAECLLYAGELERSLDLIGELLDAARRRGEVAGVRTPRLQRILGYALLAAGHVADAKDALEVSVAAARETGAEYELGLALAGLAHLAALEGMDAETFESESREVLDALGVVALPPLPAAV